MAATWNIPYNGYGTRLSCCEYCKQRDCCAFLKSIKLRCILFGDVEFNITKCEHCKFDKKSYDVVLQEQMQMAFERLQKQDVEEPYRLITSDEYAKYLNEYNKDKTK